MAPDGKESAYNAGVLGSVLGLGRSPGEGNDNPLHGGQKEPDTTEQLSLHSLGTVMAPVGVSFSLLICYNERILRLTVYWKSTHPPSWTSLVLSVSVASLALSFF